MSTFRSRIRPAHAALVALLALDLVLVTLVARRHAGAADLPAPPVQQSSLPSLAGTSPPGRHLLALSAGGGALRATSPPGCTAADRPAVVELSRDEGRTWTVVDVPAAVVVRVALSTRSAGWLIGTDRGCHTYRRYVTGDGGATWRAEDGSSGYWYPVAGGSTSVQAPAGRRALPCPHPAEDAGLSPLGISSAYAVCFGPDTTGLLRTTDGGDSWDAIAVPPTSGRAVAWPAATSGYVAGGPDAECEGTVVWRTTDARDWERVSCVTAGRATALAFTGARTGMMVVSASTGVRTLVSRDAGRTWRDAA
jgi:hypothetical protein